MDINEVWAAGGRTPTSTERVWVQVEIDAGPQTKKVLRGQMSTEDFGSIISGNYRGRYFRLTNAYWFDTVREEGTNRPIRKMVVAGRDDVWQRFTGVFYLPVQAIACLATMWDCDDTSPDEPPIPPIQDESPSTSDVPKGERARDEPPDA
jgi:hypothetical protein